MINEFRGEHYYLSNFFNARVQYEGIIYRNNEAAFQSAKVLDHKTRLQFANMEASTAKAKGRHVKLRSDWEEVKFNIMYEIVKAKFTQNKTLGILLSNTIGEYLEEGNKWGDRIWGTVNGKGENHLGEILMRVRNEL